MHANPHTLCVHNAIPCVFDTLHSSLELCPENAVDVCVVAPWGWPVVLKEYRAMFLESSKQVPFLGCYHLKLPDVHAYIRTYTAGEVAKAVCTIRNTCTLSLNVNYIECVKVCTYVHCLTVHAWDYVLVCPAHDTLKAID